MSANSAYVTYNILMNIYFFSLNHVDLHEYMLFHNIINHAFANYRKTEDMPNYDKRKKVFNHIGD
jgi:uncharacterized membrane protein YbaN (DUF454 family)